MAGCGWSREAVSVLLDEYQKYPYLYTVKTPLYHNRIARREAELKIAEVVCHIRPNTSQAEVKAKINGLRTQFTNERNKFMKCMNSGLSSSELYKPTFVWYDRMMFLIPHVSTRKSKSNLDIMNQSYSSDDSQATQIDDSSLLFDDNGDLIVHEEDELIQMQEPEQQSGRTLSSSRKRKKGLAEADGILKALQLLDSLAKKDDVDDEFGKFIASELKAIPNGRMKLLIKHKIQQALMDAQLQLLDQVN